MSEPRPADGVPTRATSSTATAATASTAITGQSQPSKPLSRRSSATAHSAVTATASGSTQAHATDLLRNARNRATPPAPVSAAIEGASMVV